MRSLFAIKAIESSFCTTVSPEVKRKCYATWIWIFTFLIYTSYHLSRKPISVVKNVLNENCSDPNVGPPPSPALINETYWCDWAPFNGEHSSSLLGALDSAYLFMYAFGMFFSGMIAERSPLNIFLCIGMISSGILTAAFGFGYTFSIHVFWYYLIVQMVCGLVQSTGWPGVVTVMGNWFGKSKRGLIMGIWNSHTSVGNILGTLIASAFLDSGWDMSFIIPGVIIAFLGIIALFFLVPEPKDVGLENPNRRAHTGDEEDGQLRISNEEEEVRQPLLRSYNENTADYIEIISQSSSEGQPIGFFKALTIPGVMEFAFSLFFSKLVSYTFLYWLPHFIYDSTSSDAAESGDLSTFFDVGGIIGGILAGISSDYTGMPASVCSAMLIVAIIVIYIYQVINGALKFAGNILMLMLVGIFVNGPYSLITTAVSAALGTHSSLQGNSKALSTVSSIIDGTGSLGAAIGPLLAGFLTNNGNWNNVFYMMIGADIFSMLLLLRLVKREMVEFVDRIKSS